MNTQPTAPAEEIRWTTQDLAPDVVAFILDITPAHLPFISARSLDLARLGAWQANDRERFAAANSELRRRNLATYSVSS